MLTQPAGIGAHDELYIGNLSGATLATQLADRVTSVLPANHIGLRQLTTIDVHGEFSTQGDATAFEHLVTQHWRFDEGAGEWYVTPDADLAGKLGAAGFRGGVGAQR